MGSSRGEWSWICSDGVAGGRKFAARATYIDGSFSFHLQPSVLESRHKSSVECFSDNVSRSRKSRLEKKTPKKKLFDVKV